MVRSLVLVLALCTACAHVEKQSPLLKRVGSPLTTSQMHTLALELCRHAIAVIEGTADRIASKSADKSARRTALVWKINGVIMFQEAALQAEPLGAAGDQLALSGQLRRYFESGAGRAAFGAQQAEAIAAMSRIQEEARKLLASAYPSGSVPPQVTRRLEAWVEQHPLMALSMERATLAGEWSLIGGATSGRPIETLATMERSTQELAERLAFANELTAKQVHWNLELMLGGIAGQIPFELMSSGAKALTNLGTLAAKTPGMIDAERRAILAGVDDQRVATLRALSGERRAAFDELAIERAIVLDALHSEREAAAQDADRIVARAFDRTFDLVDHIILRLALVLFGAFVALIAVLFIFTRHRDLFVRRRETVYP